MDRYDNNPEFQEFVKQQKQQNSIPDGCVLFLIGIVGLVLFLIVLSALFPEAGRHHHEEQQRASSAKNIVWDYLKAQEPTAKIKSISSSPLNSSVTVVQGQFKKKNAFGQYAVHQFRASIKDGEIVDFHTDFIGFE